MRDDIVMTAGAYTEMLRRREPAAAGAARWPVSLCVALWFAAAGALWGLLLAALSFI